MALRTRLIPAILLASVSSLGFNTAHAASDPVIAWNANAGAAAVKACMNAFDNNDPFHESRMYAMMHIAVHDALNAIDRKYQPYAFDKKAEQGASPDAAVAAASHDVLVPTLGRLPPDLFKKECIDAGIANVEASYTAALATIPDGPPKEQGIALGRASAAAILAKRAHDEDKATPLINKDCPAPSPGKYQCTPGFPFVAFETWETVTPFVLQDNTQFRPGPPYAVSDPAFAADLKEVQTLGGDGKTTPSARTDDQTQIALFWVENSPLKWSRIARTVATEKGLKPWENARVFAVLNMALADGYVAMAASKNHYSFWRPVTAIQSSSDKNWTPLVPTPPDQDYPSGHSIEGGVGAEVLKLVFGNDQISFQDCGTTLPAGSRCDDPKPAMRSYTSFTQAADENAYSRVLVGFHFRNATRVGTAYGRQIGARAATLLAPIQ
jgi:PAP2 superfamily